MSGPELLQFVPALAIVTVACVSDVRHRRIPNALTLPLALGGLGCAALGQAPVGAGAALAGLGLGLAIGVALLALGAWGGGDAKLLAGVGAWIGPGALLGVFLVAALIGMVIVIVQAATQRRLATLLRNSALVLVNLGSVHAAGLEHVRRTGREARSVDRPLPYALPVLLALLALCVAG